MRLALVDHIIGECEKHLLTTGQASSEIEVYLAEYALVATYSAFEQTVSELVIQRSTQNCDAKAISLIKSRLGGTQRLRVSDLAGLLGHLATDNKNAFYAQTIAHPQETQAYTNLVLRRHKTAHQGGTQLTVSELRIFYEQGHVVLDFFRDALLV